MSTKLPDGKTCNDCISISRCYFLFGCSPTETRCDFDPSRFAELEICPDCEGSGQVAGDYFGEDGITMCQKCKGNGTL